MNDFQSRSGARPRPTLGLVLLALTTLGASGCRRGSDGEGEVVNMGSSAPVVVREPCTVALGTEERTVDVNNDGRVDIVHVFARGAKVCSTLDLNFDGLVDLHRYYEPDGQRIAREYHDLDFDGRIDQIGFFEGGIVTRLELDTNFDDKIDTWLWCENGRVARAERNRLNRGRVDTWEVYERGIITVAGYDEDRSGGPEKWEYFRDGRLIALGYDENGDGEPDRRETVSAEVSGDLEQPVFCDRAAAEVFDAAQPSAPPDTAQPPASSTEPAPPQSSGGEAPSDATTPPTTPEPPRAGGEVEGEWDALTGGSR